ncbi:hypothetical protein E4U53_001634 [Claviceps sorghi]|nr:hypothetical protein E4U53_001634 [Claviceps sorghi]
MAIEIDNSSSPHSSTGVEESIRGTPDTRITSMSQEGPKSQSRKTVRVLPVAATGDVSALSALDRQYNASLGHERDPFLTSHHIQRTKLSPTASSFNPFMEAGSIRQLESASPVATTLSNELGLSRYLVISSEELLDVDKVQQWFNDLEIHGRRFYGHKKVETSAGKVHVYFNDIRDSCSILTTIMMTMRDWKVEYRGPSARDQVTATTQKAAFDMCQLLDITRSFLQSYGRLFAFVKASCTPTGSVRVIAEFCDISHALKLIKVFTQVTTPENNYSPSRAIPGFLRSDGRRQNATRVSKVASSGAANHHNYVDISRIRDGIDVRTTSNERKVDQIKIMLRNIPNKVDQIMLKRIIDESSWGKYDFMYLRIDFANDCNVGYAFINFVDPLDIIDFVEVRGNQRCDKVAEISYAKAPHYRPKLYFTSNGPRPDLAGQEEPFPEPDNQSKMKRSCENAEHVGQHYRDEQRRRRSQYDRGTRLAALEEYDYEAAIQNLYDNTQN